ncbi:MAG: hypothetical protein Q7T11_08510 [Deltaproteobacteria bacterium]|nr:hypothetical protein [Deltaproteobacteria bacterium]
MSAIWPPSNLADDEECEVLYSNITRYGIEMDKVTDSREVYHPISNEVYRAERSDAGLV